MPLQFRADTGALIMLDSGALANECCCGDTPPPDVPDLTSLMGALFEALQNINAQNGLNPTFGGGQGTAFPNQRTSPFTALPTNCTAIPANFYQTDYVTNIQYAYDDLATIITNYNYAKNFYLKTSPEGAVTLVNYSGADDYNPGPINAANFEAIKAATIALINNLLRVQVAATQVVDCCKTATATNVSTVADWANRQTCAIAIINAGACGDSTFTEDIGVGPGCTFSITDPCAATQIRAAEYTAFHLDTCDYSEGSLNVIAGHIHGDLSNFTAAASSEIFLKLENDPALPFSVPAIKPVPLNGVYQSWVAQAVGAVFDSVTVTGSNLIIPFTFIGPTPPCGPVPPTLTVGTSWMVDDQVVILTRAQSCPAS